MVNAKQLKCKLIDFLLTKFTPRLIGIEVPFIATRRWVDVLLLTKNNVLIAFEIKSDHDNIKRLKGQLKDYKHSFRQVYTVLTTRFNKKEILTSIPVETGIILFDENTNHFSIERKAKNSSSLRKTNLAYFLWRKDLNKQTKKQTSSMELRELFVRQNNLDSIYKAAILALEQRYEQRYKLFLKEKTQDKTHISDLDYLTKLHSELF